MQNAILSHKRGKPMKRASGRPNYLVGEARYTPSTYLPLNAQSRMMTAVKFASHIRSPINTQLNVNAAHLQRIDADSVFHIGHLWDGLQAFIELLRKWLDHRGITWSCIWVREYTGGKNEHHGEHWHIAFHLPPHLQSDLAAQVAIWTGEEIGEPDGTKKCIAKSLTGAWYINRRKDNAGEYLGKATPKTRQRYKRVIPNQHRQCSKFHGGEGRIEGKRFGISKTIGKTAQERLGWAA